MDQSSPRSGSRLSGMRATQAGAAIDAARANLADHRTALPHGSDAQHSGQIKTRTPKTKSSHNARRLLAGWKKIALASLLGLLLAQLCLWNATPMYSSTASLLVDPRILKTDEIVPGSIGPDAIWLESQTAIITSDGVLTKVVDDLKLADDPEFAAEKPAVVGRIIEALIPGRTSGTESERALASLKKALGVSQKAYVMDVTATTTSPQKSANIVTAVIEAYVADQTNTQSRDAKHAISALDATLDELRNQVRQAELRAGEYKKANQIPTAEGRATNAQLVTRLSAELIAAQNDATKSKAQHEQIQAAKTSGAEPDVQGEAGRTGLIARLREQLAEVARREASLSSQLKPSHPDVVNVRSQMSAVKSQITAELKRLATAAEGEYRVAANRAKELERQLEKAKQDLAQQDTAQSHARELEQDVTTSRELLKAFLAQSKETLQQDNMTAPTARVISPAAPALEPSRPLPLFVLAFGVMSGLMAGALWSLRNPAPGTAVATAADISDHTGIASVSVIPQLKRTAGLFQSNIPYGARYSELLAALDNPADRSSTAYQQAILRLLSKIKSLGRAGRPNTVMFTSARASSGNSATVLAAARSAAVSGERVLLVDATSTNPELSGIFATELSSSTTVILDSKEHLNQVVTRDERSGLSFLPIALADLRTLRIQQRRRLIAGLNLLSQDYDWIFIDAGALLDDESAATLLPAADSVFVIARSGVTEPADLQDMLQILEPARERIAGIVLTFGAA